MEIEWTDNGLVIDGKIFEKVGEGFPEKDEFGDVYICHNFKAGDIIAKTWHPVTDIDAFGDGDLDCCDWENWDTASIEIYD